MKENDQIPFHIISAAHSLVAAYFLQVAKLFKLPTLEDYIFQVHNSI